MLGRILLTGVVALICLSGCGGTGKRTGATSTSAPPSGDTFKAPGEAFTFRFPHGFQQVRPADDKNTLVLTPTPTALNNGLKVRVSSARELPFGAYAEQIRAQFQQQLLTPVSERRAMRGALELGVLEWSKTYTVQDLGTEKTIRLHSASYFFAGGGKTWQLECLSTPQYRDVIHKACQTALATLKFSGHV